MADITFDTMWKDKLTAHVEIRNNEVNNAMPRKIFS